jgi:ribonuclease HI
MKGNYRLYTDGCSKGNPGFAAGGIVIVSPDDKIVLKKKFYIGNNFTNNEAEYISLLEGIITSQKMGIKRIIISSDSQLVLRQLKGEYKVKKEHLKVFHRKIMEKLNNFDFFYFEEVYRTHRYIQIADSLANEKIGDVNKKG